MSKEARNHFCFPMTTSCCCFFAKFGHFSIIFFVEFSLNVPGQDFFFCLRTSCLLIVDYKKSSFPGLTCLSAYFEFSHQCMLEPFGFFISLCRILAKSFCQNHSNLNRPREKNRNKVFQEIVKNCRY